MSGPMERLQALDTLEKEILACLQSAGHTLQEVSKDKPSVKQVDNHTSNFLKTLNHVELELSKHINYLTQVSTGQAHEGSSYASQKVLQMAWHRSEHARSRVLELERMKNQVMSVPNPKLFGQPIPRPPIQQQGTGQQSQGSTSTSTPLSVPTLSVATPPGGVPTPTPTSTPSGQPSSN